MKTLAVIPAVCLSLCDPWIVKFDTGEAAEAEISVCNETEAPVVVDVYWSETAASGYTLLAEGYTVDPPDSDLAPDPCPAFAWPDTAAGAAEHWWQVSAPAAPYAVVCEGESAEAVWNGTEIKCR